MHALSFGQPHAASCWHVHQIVPRGSDVTVLLSDPLSSRYLPTESPLGSYPEANEVTSD